MRRLAFALLATATALAACATPDDGGEPLREVTLGPADGHDLPSTDIDRVQAGDLAPDFTLASLGGPPVTLSSFRGQTRVILVFYRGQW